MSRLKSFRLAICAAFITLSPLVSAPAVALPLSYDVVDVYSSYKIEYYISGSSASQTFYDVSRSGLSTSLGTTFDFGFFSGTQYGEISANPNAGTVTTAGYSTTNLLTPVPGASSDSTSFARNWGKHVVVGRFTVPEVGAELTTVLLDVAYAGNEGQLLFRMGGDEASFAPDVSTPGWGGVEHNAQFSFSFAAGSSVLFGFGIEPGTGIGGNFSATQTYAYPDSVTFGQFSLSYVNSTAPIPVPEPEIYAMLGIGLGLIGWVGRRKKLKESAAA